jgi:hypothetical protein
MAARRKARVARNEAILRVVHERASRGRNGARPPPRDDARMFHCECTDPSCFHRVWLTAPEYEAVRADTARFVVLPTHVLPELEWIVEAHERYAVVQEHVELHELLEEMSRSRRRPPLS